MCHTTRPESDVMDLVISTQYCLQIFLCVQPTGALIINYEFAMHLLTGLA